MNQHASLVGQSRPVSAPEPAAARLQAARRLLKDHRRQGLAALSELFRGGTLPDPPLDGRYDGKFVTVDLVPGLTQIALLVANLWMPWLGKSFDSYKNSGQNILRRGSYPLARLLNPFYRGFKSDGPKSYRAFAFRTYVGLGVADPDRHVLKIDYDLEENPVLTVQRVLDELVQLADNLYLGKAHVHWWWRPAGDWQTVAYFTLQR